MCTRASICFRTLPALRIMMCQHTVVVMRAGMTQADSIAALTAGLMVAVTTDAAKLTELHLKPSIRHS